MARESALWQRVRDGAMLLRQMRHKVDLQRLENEIGQGHPDIEGCIDGRQVWIELKSEMRPARETTVIRPKVRDSQRDWHRIRTAVGSRCHWVLLQVGEGRLASLYLIPGCYYERIVATEPDLFKLSFCKPDDSVTTVLTKASLGWDESADLRW